MKFEIQVGTDYSTVKFIGNYLTIDYKVRDKLIRYFQRLGGEITEGGNWTFPKHITSQVLEEVIHNTCFVCGGLMKDSTAMVDQKYEFEHDIYGTVTQTVPGYAKQIKVRKCSLCGHSHT